MNITEIIKKIRSGIVSISFYNEKDQKISSGSGFICQNKIISNNHVFFTPKNELLDEKVRVKIKFGDSDESDTNIDIAYGDLMKCVERGSQKHYHDFIVFNDTQIPLDDKYQFKLGDHNDVEEGERY